MKAFMKKMLLLMLVLGAAAYGYEHYQQSAKVRETDNAYVNADRVQVGSQISGVVKAVYVHEGQRVNAGELMFEIDPQPFQVAESMALARLAEAEQAQREAQKEVEAMRASVAQAEADLANLINAARRVHQLKQQNFLSAQTVDDADARVTMAKAAVAETQARLERARTHVATDNGATPAILAARATLAQARLDIEHTRVTASKSGWIARLSLVPGSLVSAHTPLFALIVEGSFWVDANFKETELPGIRAGQPVDIAVEILPGQTLHGVVESISSGTGAAFSLLPAQNATGNWVKVVQRVPVRIRLEPNDTLQPLCVGASAEVSVRLQASS